MRNSNRFLLNLGFGLAMALVANDATAQTADNAAQAGGDAQGQQNSGIAEIVVTAQKRSENVQDVPLAISAFSGSTLEKSNISSLEDIQGRSPGLVLNSFTPGQPEVAIRGVGTKEDGAGASDSTLVMVDGVYFATRTATNIDIFDLERLEILRGPQGTLFGKNAIAGVINYVTRKPEIGRAHV